MLQQQSYHVQIPMERSEMQRSEAFFSFTMSVYPILENLFALFKFLLCEVLLMFTEYLK